MTDKTDNKKNQNPEDAAMTPPEEKTPRSGRGWWRHVVGILATFVIVAAIFILLPVSKNLAPQDAARTAWAALQKNDLTLFEQAVNTDALVQSIIEQAVVYEETIQQGQSAAAEEIRRVMRSGMIGAFRHDLSNTYSKQIKEIVKTGTPPEKHEGLMAKLWQETGARKDDFTDMRLTDQHEKNALMALTFKRPDLGGHTLSLNLLLERSAIMPEQGWAITGVPNLASYLLQIEHIRSAMLAKINTPIKVELERAITFMDVQKSKGLDEQNPGVLWRIAYLNSSDGDIESFNIRLSVYNAEGILLKTKTFTQTDTLPAGATAEKAWPMHLSPQDTAEAQILEQDLRTLQLNTDVTQITFRDGRTLALFDELPTPARGEKN